VNEHSVASGDALASAGISTSDAYRLCEAITRTQAANFYYGIRLLPRDRRQAMCAAYAFARRVDDIGDGTLPHEEKLRLLDEAASDLAALERDGPGSTASGDPVIVALSDAHTRFALPAGALGELIEGVRMDVDGVGYETFDELVLYCRRVAGAIGRVCLAMFGRPDADAEAAGGPSAESLADDLGVALQLTNILRDVREDAQNGRVYLPAEDLRRFGLIGAAQQPQASELLLAIERAAAQPHGGAMGAERGSFDALVRFQAERAQEWFDRGMQLVPLLDRRSAACVRAMAGIYHGLLERLEADPERMLRERVSLPAREKLWVALRSMLGGRQARSGRA
jgi:15-cis-phytoene synthase